MTIRPAARVGAAATALLIATAGSAVRVAAQASAITPQSLERRLRIIADDSMMGRETGSLGDFKTAAYVADEFKRLGLAPAGDGGTYFQTVPFWTIAADPRSSITVGAARLTLGRDFLPTSAAAPALTLVGAHAIYAGPANDSTRWPRGEDATGKIVVFEVPASVQRITPINPRRWPGAAAVAFIALERYGPEQVARVIDGRVVADTTIRAGAVRTLQLTRHAAAVLLGGSPDSLDPGAVGPELSASVGFTRHAVAYPARNVVAILPGSDARLRGEYVALTAHNDHVGFDHSPVDHDSLRAFDRVVRPMGADSPPREPTAEEWTRIRAILDSLRRVNRPRLDSIRNGADDDGTGTVSILEIAQAMVSSPRRPRRSILFVSHTAEEAGLLGSAWFTDHATVPLDSVVAEIDQDMVGRGLPTDFPRPGSSTGASPTYLEVVGDQKLSLAFAGYLEKANAAQPVPFEFDRSYAVPGHPLQYYCRADHYNYARYGIPAVALSRGEHLDYHQVTDEAQYISYPDLARVSRMVYDAATLIANANERPKLDVSKPADPHAACRQ
ncbi:MAG TPA: M28 family peptidase [Gemmatimonadaceae bacterium]|nr:M28 family peptidase [Gemmatimonadaceae bacterium]